MSLQDYYDNIDLDKIHEFLDDKQEEHLQLDFKEVADSGMDKNDRKVFGKAMSGFANSSGGIIIWGVEACKQNGEEHDVACSLPMVKDATLLLNKLNEHTGTLVAPTVEGVRHEAIIANDKGAGFIKSLIPASLSGPHMSNREKVYYKRSGDSFYKMEHFDIADMFGKRRSPKLSLKVTPNYSQRPEISVFLHNYGRGIAHFSYADFNFEEPYGIFLDYGVDNANFTRVKGNNDFRYNLCASSEQIIHPETSILVAKITTPSRFERYPRLLEMDYQITAEGISMTRGNLSVDLSEIIPPEKIIHTK